MTNKVMYGLLAVLASGMLALVIGVYVDVSMAWVVVLTMSVGIATAFGLIARYK